MTRYPVRWTIRPPLYETSLKQKPSCPLDYPTRPKYKLYRDALGLKMASATRMVLMHLPKNNPIDITFTDINFSVNVGTLRKGKYIIYYILYVLNIIIIRTYLRTGTIEYTVYTPYIILYKCVNVWIFLCVYIIYRVVCIYKSCYINDRDLDQHWPTK